jgi:hypothetical protein
MSDENWKEILDSVFLPDASFHVRYADDKKQKVEQQYATVTKRNKGDGMVTLRTNRSVKVGMRNGRPRYRTVELYVWPGEAKVLKGKVEIGGGVMLYPVRPGTADPFDRITFELIESDLPYDGRLYRVLRDGAEIGWVESYKTTNDSPISGTRLRRVGAQVTRWHVARTRRGLHSRDERIGYYHDTRKQAVERLLAVIDR